MTPSWLTVDAPRHHGHGRHHLYEGRGDHHRAQHGANGANASGTTRAMNSGSDYLSYEIYQDATRTTVWGNSGTGLFTPPTAPSKSPRTFTTYGRVPAAQDVPASTSYTDSVTATVNF